MNNTIHVWYLTLTNWVIDLWKFFEMAFPGKINVLLRNILIALKLINSSKLFIILKRKKNWRKRKKIMTKSPQTNWLLTQSTFENNRKKITFKCHYFVIKPTFFWAVNVLLKLIAAKQYVSSYFKMSKIGGVILVLCFLHVSIFIHKIICKNIQFKLNFLISSAPWLD